MPFLFFLIGSLCWFSTLEASSLGQISFLGFSRLQTDTRICASLNTPLATAPFGGISGVEYDATQNHYWLLSDDPGYRAPPRFYKMKIHLDQRGIHQVHCSDVRPLQKRAGHAFGLGQVDGEEIRLYNNRLLWSSEAQNRLLGLDPAVRMMDFHGVQTVRLQLPEHYQSQAGRVVDNGSFEGLTLLGKEHALLAVEHPLKGDGTNIRLLKLDLQTHDSVATYAYPQSFYQDKELSVVSLLAVNDTQVLVLERLWPYKDGNILIRLVLYDLTEAQDVHDMAYLQGKHLQYGKKQLLANITEWPEVRRAVGYLDNQEGMTWGPTLVDGRRTLLLVSDNNFNSKQSTLFLAFALALKN
ncbi:esterase-like activity of phytase family protein [Magnetococcus sp. PR-3]|uniref:esterase-like activity of phytase family protein n=1 Tax=Magnetococcus sp. PR-3 TaxID=3120355 RepID=UPI002FCE543C